MLIRKATRADLEPISIIEERVFSYPWTRDQLAYELTARPGVISLVLEEKRKIIGYLFAQGLAGGVRILNLAVSVPYQRRGYGKHLLRTFLKRYCNHKPVTLEVKRSNLPALKLYCDLGFKEVGIRKNYYEDGEDALVLRRAPQQQKILQSP
ncbi:MAG: ribosomal protein S18-alanine N-acetyltransferase [Fidelibacterota bacterium]